MHVNFERIAVNALPPTPPLFLPLLSNFICPPASCWLPTPSHPFLWYFFFPKDAIYPPPYSLSTPYRTVLLWGSISDYARRILISLLQTWRSIIQIITEGSNQSPVSEPQLLGERARIRRCNLGLSYGIKYHLTVLSYLSFAPTSCDVMCN